VPAPLVALVEPRRIPYIRLPERLGQRIGLLWNRYEMDVIRHEAIAHHVHAVFAALARNISK